MIKSKEKLILKYAILDEPNTMIIMGFKEYYYIILLI